MQGALSGRGYSDSQTNIGGAASWFAERASPALGQAPHIPAGPDGQHLHSLSESGPGLSRSGRLIFETKLRRKKCIFFQQMLQYLGKVDHQLVATETLHRFHSLFQSDQV